MNRYLSLKPTASLHLKMDAWNITFLLGWRIFSGVLVSFREGYFYGKLVGKHTIPPIDCVWGWNLLTEFDWGKGRGPRQDCGYDKEPFGKKKRFLGAFWEKFIDTVDGRNLAPVDTVGSLSHYLRPVFYIPAGCLGFLNHQLFIFLHIGNNDPSK